MRDSWDRFVADLAGAEIGRTHNQYSWRDSELDLPEGPAVRTANLLTYLRSHSSPKVLLVGEAPGYRGCRFSGIAFTSERSLPVSRWSSTRASGWQESSATIVQRTLNRLGIERSTLLWNAVPTHPAAESPLSNRTPSKEELEEGAEWFQRMTRLARPALVVAVGRSASGVLPAGVACVRHPANGGAGAFSQQLESVLYESGLLPDLAMAGPSAPRWGRKDEPGECLWPGTLGPALARS
jgi:uracil-DNA glycosylase